MTMNERYITFNSDFKPHTANGLTAALSTAVNEGVATIHLLLSTVGGDCKEGLTLYNFIRALPAKVIIYNVGQVNSIGNVVFQAGTRRIAAPNSNFMFHGVGFDIQNERLERSHLKQKMDALDKDQAQIAAIMAARTALKPSEIDKLFETMAFLSANDARERGIVDDVTDIRIPAGIPIFNLVFG